MRPNILLITADDMNYNSAGAFACPVEGITPNIDRLASEGMIFKHSHVTIAVCQPSRECLMTGRYPHNNGAPGFHPIREDVPTLQEELKKAGYMNGIVGKVSHLAPSHKFCWDYSVNTMSDEYGMGRDPKRYYEFSLEFMKKAKEENKPFFFMANSHDPHRPFVGSQQESQMFGYHTEASKYYKPDDVNVPGFLPDIPLVRQELAEYYSSVHRLDESVGAVLHALDECGFSENTLVMFLSDNGMAFPYAKTNCYLNSTKTPWVVKWPGKVKPGVKDDVNFISGIDYMPTIMEAAGIPSIDGMDGTSFLPVILGNSTDCRNNVFTVFNTTRGEKSYPMRCLQDSNYGYIYNAWSDGETVFMNESKSGLTYNAMKVAADENEQIKSRVNFFDFRVKEEFYDFENDPDALNNLFENPEYRDSIQKMKNALLEVMRKTNDPVAEQFRTECF